MTESKWKENFEKKSDVCYVDNQGVEHTYEEIKKWAFNDDKYVKIFYRELIEWESGIPPGTLTIINQQEDAYDWKEFDNFENMPYRAKITYISYKLEQIAIHDPKHTMSKSILEQVKLLNQLI